MLVSAPGSWHRTSRVIGLFCVHFLFFVFFFFIYRHINRYREQTYGHGERGGEGETYGESNVKLTFSLVAQSCPALCDPMNRSTPGLPVHHQLPESTQTHVHRVGDAIQLSHPLSSPSPPALNLSQHQVFFKWVTSSHQVAKVLEIQLQHQSFQRSLLWKDWSPLGWTGWISLQSKGLSRVFSNTTVQKHQFFGTQLCL